MTKQKPELKNTEFKNHSQDRRQYILMKVLKIVEHYSLSMQFYQESKKILTNLWDNIKNTRDDIIVALICSLSILTLNEVTVPVSVVCHKLGIKVSTVQTHIKRHIFEHYNVSGFVSLLKSSDLLGELMVEKGIV